MSFILDALEKADKKRKAGAVPDLQTMHGRPKGGTAHKKWWPYLIIGLLTIQTIGVSTWLLLRQSPESTGEKSLPVAPAPPLETAPTRQAETKPQQPVVIVLKERVYQSPPAAPVASPQDRPLPAAHESAQVQTEVAAPLAEPITEETLEPAAPTPVDPPPESLVEPRGFEDLTPPPLPVMEEEVSARRPSRAPTVIDDTQERKNLPDISELPSSIRKELPDISISYHAYANNPSSRLASINGRIVRQGQEADNGLLVEEITATGVVLKFKSHRFRMDVF